VVVPSTRETTCKHRIPSFERIVSLTWSARNPVSNLLLAVTGWKGLFVNKAFTKRINDVTKDESDYLLNYLHALCHNNFDSHVRFRWSKPGSLALWDNRSTQHSAIYDVGSQARAGDRACSVGEAPYFDPSSSSRREALAAEDKKW
jgi:alpha-ketoglutarate-dependent taurine dioxygenase